MLIIFDLDDTLIDTSGSVTPFKMKECLKRMIQEGLEIDNFDRAYADLLTLNSQSERSKDALDEFVKKRGGTQMVTQAAIAELTAPLPENFSIPTTPNAKEILNFFKSAHTLVIVTGGTPPFQIEKMEKAGLDRSVFSNIAIPEDSVKKPFYERFRKEFSMAPEQVIVCGDRIGMDLAPARDLGFTTIHMRWGRGKSLKTEKWIHHTISDLSELKGIIKV